jgi:lipoprotein-anchoring transpeptidase ErfK/SrfK
MFQRAAVLFAFALVACAAAPASSQMPAIAPGVRVDGIAIGGLTSEPARARLENAFSRAIPVLHGKRHWWASPRRFGAGAGIDAAVAHALDAAPGTRLPLHVRYSETKVTRFVNGIARTFDQDAVDAKLVGLGPAGPEISEGAAGVAVRRALLRREIELELQRGLREPIGLPTQPVAPTVTRANFGPVIVISRSANTLSLYDSTQLVRSFGVATGRSEYPTPAGLWSIVDMQMNPWWHPPSSDWARGLQPIPPGPGNPLGTRWMGLSAPGVGIHGTPDAASIGYSASHGCIRMHIPDAEWLFQHVHVGVPVLIV